MQNLSSSMMRVLGKNGATIGAGFLVGERLALTCTHVVADALGISRQTAEAPQGVIRVEFPLLAEGQVLEAQVSMWHLASDLAGLELSGDMPAGVKPAVLVDVGEMWGHPFRAFGFPMDLEQGVWGRGEICAENIDGLLQLVDTQAHGYFVQPGFSGGPVWDDALEGVIGMVVAAHPAVRTAYCLAVNRMARAFPALVDLAIGPLDRLRQVYYQHITHTYHALDFRGIPQLESFTRELLLEDVYVPLVARPDLPKGGETLERRLAGRMLGQEDLPPEALAMLEKGESAEPVPMEDALANNNRVVVLGDPGSGKTTLLKHLALTMAAQPDGALPILLPLTAYARALQTSDPNLQAYLAQYFAGFAQELSGLAPLFATALDRGQAVILLDGLDEVQEDRARLVQKVEAFATQAVEKGNKVAVTSRIVGYLDAPLKASDWRLYTLLDFDRKAIEQFVDKWCWAFEKSTLGDTSEARNLAERERCDLLESIDANPGVERLASNPLLLTILALIKRQGVALPNRRVELYELYLVTLIRAWNKARSLDKQQVGPDLNPNEILMTLGPLALWLRHENPTAGVVTEEALLGELTRHFTGEEWGLPRGEARQRAHGFLESVRRYSNLLVERGPKQYGFLHLTFEEMLAAYGLYQQSEFGLEGSLRLIRQHLTDSAWRETILLSVGVWGLANRQPRKASQVVQAILDSDPGAEHPGENILLAGACLEDVGEEGLGRMMRLRVWEALEAAMRQRSLPPAVQRDAGFLLGRTGWLPPGLDDFVPIPAGQFLYGDEKQPVLIEEPFEIARYPVTNVQYRRFVAAGGYDKPAFWSEAGWEWCKKEKVTEPRFWHVSRWNNPLAPVVGVSWYEAEAYCTWLAAASGRLVRLPTEQEWERAARGTEGRAYPWGEHFDRHKVNCAAFWKQDDNASWAVDLPEASTTVVGQFHEGNTPEGISDLSGNVWEWTASIEGSDKVLRGGSWGLNRDGFLAARRYGYGPNVRYGHIGFRPARSP